MNLAKLSHHGHAVTCCSWDDRLNNDLSELFTISNYAKQGLVPMILTINAITTSVAVSIAACSTFDDHKLTQTIEEMIHDLLFADDAALVTHIERSFR